MRKLLTALSMAMMMSPVLAQETATEAPAENTVRSQLPREITRDVIGAWQIKCFTGGNEQCFLYQLVVGNNNNPLLEYTMVPVVDETGGDVVLGATLVTPLNVILPRGILQDVDQVGAPVKREYDWCAPVGCYARYGLTLAEVEAYRTGERMDSVIFTVQNPNAEISIPVSLDGFGDAYDALLAIEAEQDADAEQDAGSQ